MRPAWREANWFFDRERAAPAWTEAVTSLEYREVPDDVFAQAGAEFSEQELADLTMAVIAVNGATDPTSPSIRRCRSRSTRTQGSLPTSGG